MNQPDKSTQSIEPLPLREITVLLVKHYGLREGLWDINFELQVGIGRFGMSDKVLPGAMLGISRVGVTKTPAEQAGPNTVNAADLNEMKTEGAS